jgi:DNA-directed RNA polymerase specialized sigma24 family protein
LFVMSEPASVSQWIVDVKADGQEAAQRLYNRYLRRLAKHVRKRMNGTSRRMNDEEDVAHAALTSLFMQIRRGSFPQVANRCDLWQVLIMLANRRVVDLKRREFSLKRGAGREVGESALGECGDMSGDCRAIEQVIGHEPPPEMVVELEDVCRRLLDQLDDPLMKQTAALKLEGYDQAEIAQRVGCAPRSVQRKLGLIRKVWMAGQ